MTGADNQQERLDAGWVVGFVDGEGCFHVGINKMPKKLLGWHVLPEFRVVQHERDEEALHRLRAFFGFGSVGVNRTDRHGTRKEFRVRGLENLAGLVGFFKRHPLQTPSKRRNFELFAEIIGLMQGGKHLTKDGLDRIAAIVSEMNRRPRIRYLESSETIRQTE